MTHLAGMIALHRLFERCPPNMHRPTAAYHNAPRKLPAPRKRKSTSAGLRRRYTREDVAYIKAHYPELSSAVIARAMGRSPSAVKEKITRMGLQGGHRRGRSKLTPTDVRAIRASREPHKVLAARYGVDRKAISRITRRVSWAQV